MSDQDARDNERERLAGAILRADEALPEGSMTLADWSERLADFLLAAGYGTHLEFKISDAEALRLGKVAWVAHQGDTDWARSVVEDCFSPADDLPEEALDMIAVARAVVSALRVPVEGEDG